ncbi:hypothetical protein TNCV_293381, partial [Trichonephila clavipes]
KSQKSQKPGSAFIASSRSCAIARLSSFCSTDFPAWKQISQPQQFLVWSNDDLSLQIFHLFTAAAFRMVRRIPERG